MEKHGKCLPPGFEPRTVRPGANRYTDYVNPAVNNNNTDKQNFTFRLAETRCANSYVN